MWFHKQAKNKRNKGRKDINKQRHFTDSESNRLQIHIRQFTIRFQFWRLSSIPSPFRVQIVHHSSYDHSSAPFQPIDAMRMPIKFDTDRVFPKYATDAKMIETRLNVLQIEYDSEVTNDMV